MQLKATNIHTPFVSIVIPCLNIARYLTHSIESILRQDYPHIECFVVDGGSTDNTLEILHRFGDQIKWISEPDNGHADAINKGWRMCKGEILSWLNADDLYVVPDAVSKAAAYLENNPTTDVVYGDYASISEDGKVISPVIKSREWDLVYAVKYCVPVIYQPTSFIRRSVLEKAGWLDPKFSNGKDHDLWLRIGLKGTIKHAPFHAAYVRRCFGLSQRSDMAKSKIELTKKFFSIDDLPAPFNSPQFRRRAMSNAYLTAGEYTWYNTKSLIKSLRYVFKAVITDPLNLCYVSGAFFLYVLFFALPLRWREKLRYLYGKLRNNKFNSQR